MSGYVVSIKKEELIGSLGSISGNLGACRIHQKLAEIFEWIFDFHFQFRNNSKTKRSHTFCPESLTLINL